MAKKLPLITDFDNIPEAALVPEVEQPYEIPEHWKWVRLGAVLNQMETRKPSGSHFTYIDIDAIDNRTQTISNPKTLATAKAPSRASRAVNHQDTLFSLVRPYLMNIAFVDQHFTDAIASTGFYVCSPADAINPRYLFYLVSSPSFVHQASERMRGDNSPSIKSADFVQLPAPLPPFEEQGQIVEYLEKTNRKIDDVIQRLERYVDDAPNRRRELIQAGVSGLLSERWREQNGSSFKDWRSSKLVDLGKWGGGGTPRKSHTQYWEGGTIRWITPKDMKSDQITYTLDHITELGAEESSARKYSGPGICMVIRSGILRRILPVGRVDGDFTVNQDMKVITNISETNLSDYIFWSLVANEERIRSICSKSGTTVESIDFGKLMEYSIELPSRSEQEEIVRIIQIAIAKIDLSVNLIRQAISDIGALRESTVLSVLSGRMGLML